MLLHQNSQIVTVIAPVDLATTNNIGDRVNMDHYNHIAFIYSADPGTASQDAILQFEQYQAATGGTPADLIPVFDNIAFKQAATDLTAVGVFTRLTDATTGTYTISSNDVTSATGGERAELVIVEFDASALTAGYTFVSVLIDDTGGTAGKIGCVIAILTEPRYAQAINLSAIA